MFLRILVLGAAVLAGAALGRPARGEIVAVLWLSARNYRVGILMYGKKPTFPELMKWVAAIIDMPAARVSSRER